jgi:hypothetical protein
VNHGHEAIGVKVDTRSAAGLLTLAVRLRGLGLGRTVDLFLDRDDLRLVGFHVLCGDDEHRVLPLAAARIAEDGIEIASPLVLLEEAQLDFYSARTFSLDAIRGRPVRKRDRDVGVLRDLRLNADSTVAAVVVEADGREETLRFDGSIRFDPRRRSAA